MSTFFLKPIDISSLVKGFSEYTNAILSGVNDHVVRVSVMTEPFFWHRHPNSDEVFLVVEGSVYIDLEDRTVQLHPGQLFAVPKDVIHRTRPAGGRSVNLTIEKNDTETVRINPSVP